MIGAGSGDEFVHQLNRILRGVDAMNNGPRSGGTKSWSGLESSGSIGGTGDLKSISAVSRQI